MANASIEDRLGPADQNKRLVRQVYEDIRSDGRLDLIDEVLHPEYVGHDPTATPTEVRGTEGFKEQTRGYRSVFPDLRFTIDSLVGEDDNVVARWRAKATHAGSLTGETPTGKRVVTSGFGSWRISHGRIIEHFGVFDIMGLLRQMGVKPD
jgi:predicted ester cyclase